MKITKDTGELAPGTVVELPDGEYVEIVKYRPKVGNYIARYLDFDGSEFVPAGGERVVYPWELVGGEV